MNIAGAAFAVLLGYCAILAAVLSGQARPMARDYLRFAAVLYLALALCRGILAIHPDATILTFADAVTLAVMALGPASLALAIFAAFEHPPPAVAATLILILACVAAIAAAATGVAVLALVPLAASVFIQCALCARRWRANRRPAVYGFVSACALLCSAAAMQSGGVASGMAMESFSAAALLGFALALARRSHHAVAKKSNPRRAVPVGRSG